MSKRVLIVEDNDIERSSIAELLGHDDIELLTAVTGAEALAAMRESACSRDSSPSRRTTSAGGPFRVDAQRVAREN